MSLRGSFKYLGIVGVVAVLVACGDTSTSRSSRTTATTGSASTQIGFERDHFADDAIAGEVATGECTLSGGTTTTCVTFTIAGTPASYSTGPFCPTTVTTPAADAGIWFDGNGTYDLTGSFITNLATFYGDAGWHMYDDQGKVKVTDTRAAFDGAARPDVDPQYQNHCVEGKVEWLAGGKPVQRTVTIPKRPALAAGTTTGRPQDLGVTLDGIVIAQSAPVAAILGAHTIAAFDDCGGHFNPVEGYHLHGATGCGKQVADRTSGETAMFGYAMDGFPIHLPLTGDALAAAGLDECGGHATPGEGYHYHANDPSKNAVVTCLKGEYVATAGGPGGQGGPPPGGGPGGPPAGAPGGTATERNTAGTTAMTDLNRAAATLDVTVHQLEDALVATSGGDLTSAAAVLGVPVDDLRAALADRATGTAARTSKTTRSHKANGPSER